MIAAAWFSDAFDWSLRQEITEMMNIFEEEVVRERSLLRVDLRIIKIEITLAPNAIPAKRLTSSIRITDHNKK